MDIYVSCIKIRGKPILPPLMTDDVRAEMSYYKQLARAVEDKLSKYKLAGESEIAEINNEQSAVDSPDAQVLDPTINNNSLSKKESFTTKTNSGSIEEGCRVLSDDETITGSTDINRYMNISDSSKTDITETISETTKPRVPQTLDIVPFVVNTTQQNSDNSSPKAIEFEEETPKLVRQGSYILDTPSPMLLANLEDTRDNYIPITSINGIQQQEWQITQVTSHCKSHNKSNKDIQLKRRNSISESGLSNSNNSPLTFRKHQKVKSADCIQTLLSNDSSIDNKICKSAVKEQTNSVIINYVSESPKINKKNYIFNQTNKIKTSVSNGNSPNNRKKYRNDYYRITRSFESPLIDNYEYKHLQQKCKPILITDKLLYVFNEIQKTHEQQIADLMARQQKEQLIMQQQFEQQQLMLLSQIEKSFPGISLPLLAQKITGTKNSITLSQFTEPNESGNSTSPLNGSSLESDGSISMTLNDRSLSACKLNRTKRESSVSRELFPLKSNSTHVPIANGSIYNKRHIKAAIIINAYARGYLVRRLMKTERVITLKNTYQEALHCMLKLHIDAPLELPELNFHQRLQHQCDATSISIVELFAQNSTKRMEIISQDRQIKQARNERPLSSRSSFSFATQRTLARKKFKHLGIPQMPETPRSSCSVRTRCQTWTSNARDKRSPAIIYQGIKRSTSAGAVRKPWR